MYSGGAYSCTNDTWKVTGILLFEDSYVVLVGSFFLKLFQPTNSTYDVLCVMSC